MFSEITFSLIVGGSSYAHQRLSLTGWEGIVASWYTVLGAESEGVRNSPCYWVLDDDCTVVDTCGRGRTEVSLYAE